MKKKKNVYLTKDLFEASYLYASNQIFLGLEEIGNNRYEFIFDDAEDCIDKINSYWRKEAMVNAKEFADSIRSLKGKLFQAS